MSSDAKQWWTRMGLTMGIALVAFGTAAITTSWLEDPSVPGHFALGNILVAVGAMLIPACLSGAMR